MDRLRQAADDLADGCAERSLRIGIHSADVSDPAQVDAAVASAIEHYGEPDILVANAGVARPGYFEILPLEVFRETMEVNYFGVVHAVRAVVPRMIRRRSGSIMIVSSGAAIMGIFGYTAYGASKFALRGLAEALRAEMRHYGISVGIAYPPDTDTPQLEEENKTKPPETKAITETSRLRSAREVALCIVRGIEQNSVTVLPGVDLKTFYCLQGLAAPLIRAFLDWKIRGISPR
jgi:3-dehydrosphinganine reductase